MSTHILTTVSELIASFGTRAEREFAAGYVECLAWCGYVLTPSEEEHDSTEMPTPDRLGTPFHPSALATFREDIESFLDYGGDTWDLLEEAESTGYVTWAKLGHDLWLTRNGHGAGYWDRGLGEVGTKLTAAAKLLGSQDLYVSGDPPAIYVF